MTRREGPPVTADDVTADDMAAALAAATGDESLLSAGISAATRLEGDLCLDSLDLAAVGALLRDRYGTAVDLPRYVAGLDIDKIIELTVARTDTTELERGYTGQRGQDEQNRRARKAAVQTPGKTLTMQTLDLNLGGIH